jgi:hypothetical protein
VAPSENSIRAAAKCIHHSSPAWLQARRSIVWSPQTLQHMEGRPTAGHAVLSHIQERVQHGVTQHAAANSFKQQSHHHTGIPPHPPRHLRCCCQRHCCYCCQPLCCYCCCQTCCCLLCCRCCYCLCCWASCVPLQAPAVLAPPPHPAFVGKVCT